ncbi:MAG: selenide, water dikinase SelD [Firmicutes bacterium]|nr:selenide, water dikinase SelD [Bacillota bacterium]
MDSIKLTKLSSCSGCGAKVGAKELSEILNGLKIKYDENLIVGFDKSDDAAVYKISDDLAIVQTIDFFPPIADDPYVFGQIAAANALSDIYAMGGEPKIALNVMCIPKDMPRETVNEILRGGYDKVFEAGAVIAGGHSIFDEEPKYGLTVTGFVNPNRILTNAGAETGDVLILTKPLGSGILTSAVKADLISENALKALIKNMTSLNKTARDIMVKYNVHACTDVTGFGLMGHLSEMCLGSEKGAEIYTKNLNILPETVSFAKIGIIPEGMYRNREFAEKYVDAGDKSLYFQDILFDPQTSGGLLMAAAPEDANKLFAELYEALPGARIIGKITEIQGDKLIKLI